MSKSIFAIFKNLQTIEQVVHELNSQGFQYNTISIFGKAPTTTEQRFAKGSEYSQSPYGASEEEFSEETITRSSFAREQSARSGTPSQRPGSSKGNLPQGLSRIPGITQIDLPGTGPCISAGPLQQFLKSNQSKGTNGQLLTNALTKLGLPENQATRIAKKLSQNNNVLLVVQANTQEDVESVKEIFENHNATDVTVSAEMAAMGKKSSQW